MSMLKAISAHPLVLITGVTGGLGSALLPRLLKANPDSTFVALVRAKDEQAANIRLKETLEFCNITDSDSNRVVAVHGDICKEHLGLDERLYEKISDRVGNIFHLAADLRFNVSIEDSRAANVVSTEHVLRFAGDAASRGAKFQRFNYVSTAFTCGLRTDRVLESELDVGQEFANNYEKAKLEAELLVRRYLGDMPITIYRPSMVIGESKTGKIRTFIHFYDFLKLADRGKIPPIVPAYPDARPDLVPVDYVADAITFLSAYPHAVGETYHLTAGLERSMSIGSIVDLMWNNVEFSNLKTRPKLIPFEQFEKKVSGKILSLFRNSAFNILLHSYIKYLVEERNFDVDRTATILSNNGIHFPSINQVLPVTARSALECNFGEALISQSA